MTHEQKLAELTAKIQELVPEICDELKTVEVDGIHVPSGECRDVRLADVLAAVNNVRTYKKKRINTIGVNRSGGIFIQYSAAQRKQVTYGFWNLSEPLENQSDETKQLLYDILFSKQPTQL